MPSRMYNRGMYQIISQAANWDTGDIRLLLLDNTYAFNPDANFVADISGDEIATANYVRKVLQNTTITEDDANDRVVLDADDETWVDLGPPAGGPVVGGAAIFLQVGADAANPLLTFEDFVDTQVNGGDFDLLWSAVDGIIETTSP